MLGSNMTAQSLGRDDRTTKFNDRPLLTVDPHRPGHREATAAGGWIG